MRPDRKPMIGHGGMIAGKIQNIMIRRGKTLSTAESCTGGRIASAVTAIPGSSDYFQGSVVAYQNEVKETLLGVGHDIIEHFNVVSREVVIEMVKGACRLFDTDYAIATSGCAGPGGGTEDIPVGTIWIAYGSPGDIRTFRCEGDKGRVPNVEQAAEKSLELFLEYLECMECDGSRF
ncbi:MAG: CinA family protein [Bacteroides sp.]|nr:CinA family protein [Roseburia sp.]MCM1347436.1 CinA family protein [Bacteroides sp.]MCM1421205.1 CinA family protein [Bacteroides sp.]